MSDQAPPPLPPGGAPPPLPGQSDGATPATPATAAPPVAEPAPTESKPLSSTCPNCGAQAAYAPGTTSLQCGSCGSLIEIAASTATIQEHSYDEWRAKHGTVEVASLGAQVVQCRGCGATTETTDLAGSCQFCGGALVALDHPEGLVAPEAVLPFHVDRNGAKQEFGTWIKSRWFAPNALKKVGSTEGLQGTYVPHWTFDAHTETDYRGQRGEYYYVTVSYQVSDGKGGSTTQTRQERRTRWYPASGHVNRSFDDILVAGSHHFDPKRLDEMGPWKLEEAKPFQQEYLTGYSALRYDVDPKAGAAEARKIMRRRIEDDCENDIGGDEQRVSDMDVTYSEAMFKLMLMPVWVAAYLYGGKSWQVLVNANTGEVVGDRPWSWVKITALVLAILVVVGVVAGIYASSK